MRSDFGQHGTPPRSMFHVWQIAFSGSRSRTDSCTHLSRSRGSSASERQTAHMNVPVSATDERSIEVVASGLPLNHGAQLAVDVTLSSALTSCGTACSNAATVDGVVLTKACRDKETKHAELVQGGRCRLVLVWLPSRRADVGVRRHCSLSRSARSQDAPPALQRSAFLGWRRRWTRMLSISCCRAFAASLTAPADVMAGVDGITPNRADLFGEA